MTQIAAEARQLVEQQEEDANEITSIGEQAATMSNEAFNLAYSARQQQLDNSNKIDGLRYKLSSVETKIATVEKLTSDSLAKATDAYNEALTIKQQVLSLEVPSVDSAAMEAKAKQIMTDAERIKADAELLLTSNQDLLQNTMGKRAELQDLLNRANIQQQEVDRRLADMDRHRAKALEAVKIGNNVLKDADNTLETLKDFENR